MWRCRTVTALGVSALFFGLSVRALALDGPAPTPIESPAAESEPAAPDASLPRPARDGDDLTLPETKEVMEARTRLSRGEQLFEAGDFAGARTEFLRCYELLEGHPRRFAVLFNIAQTQQWEYDYVAAIATYRRYLDEGGSEADERDNVEATLTLLTALLSRVDVQVSPAHAELWVDGRRRAKGSALLPIPGGRHLLEAHAEGYESARRDLLLTAGSRTSLSLSLSPVDKGFQGLARPYFWTTSAVAGALFLTGGTLGIVTLKRRADLERRLDDPVERWEVRDAERDNVRSSGRTADALLISGAVVGVGAVVLGLLTDWSHE